MGSHRRRGGDDGNGGHRLRAEGGDHVAFLDEPDDPDVRRVQRGGQRVRGEVGVPDHTLGDAQMLGERRADALRDTGLDTGSQLLRVEDAADVLGHGHLDHPDRTSVGCGRHCAVAQSSLPASSSATVVDSTPSYEVILPSAMLSSSVDMPNLAASGWRSWARTIFAARSTAPPETQVCRLRAPAPAGGWSVSTEATCTSSMPRVSCTICRARVVKPWPVSTAAQSTVATVPSTLKVAVDTSSWP
jgi:hypothetical protein